MKQEADGCKSTTENVLLYLYQEKTLSTALQDASFMQSVKRRLLHLMAWIHLVAALTEHICQCLLLKCYVALKTPVFGQIT